MMHIIGRMIKQIIIYINPKIWLTMRLLVLRITGRKETELDLLKFVVPRNRCAVDIGANKGVYIYELLKLSANVIAIEPNPDCAKELRQLFGSRITLIEGALSNSSGTVELSMPKYKDGRAYLGTIEEQNPLMAGDVEQITVSMMKLDELSLEDVGFIKIDVEGHEESVIVGGEQTIRRNRPILLVEAEDRHRPQAVTRLCVQLEQLGYVGFFIENGALKSIKYFNPSVHQSKIAAEEIWERKKPTIPYYNNFLFIPYKDADKIFNS